MENVFGTVAELKIREAIEKGELKNLPGKGKPVVIENMLFVPPDERLAFTIMKNAGVEPLEVALNKEMAEIKQAMKSCGDEKELAKLQEKLRNAGVRYSVLMEKRRGRK